MKYEKIKDIKKDDVVKYGFFTNVKIHDVITINNIQYVVIKDKYNQKKSVYADLFLKYSEKIS